MSDKLARRELNFTTFDEVIRDIDNLRSHGYEKAGTWDLAQVCGHLAEWVRYPVDRYPKPGCMVGTMLWLVKLTLGKSMRNKILTSGKMPSGKPTMKETLVPAGMDEARAVAKLKESVEKFTKHQGEYHPSPLFGAMNREEFGRFQLIHCASFEFLNTKDELIFLDDDGKLSETS